MGRWRESAMMRLGMSFNQYNSSRFRRETKVSVVRNARINQRRTQGQG